MKYYATEVAFIVCFVVSVIFFNLAILEGRKQISILKYELKIDETYLSNIHLYKRPLWVSEKDKLEFMEWRRETAEREISK